MSITFGLNDGDDVQLKGATDATLVGNVGDRLKVDAVLSTTNAALPAWHSTLRYDDMNVASGGIARGTSVATSATWTTTYTYSGSGYIAGLLLTLETFSGWEFRMLVDGVVIFSFMDTDLTNDSFYDVDDVSDFNTAFLGISKGAHDKFTWHSPLEIPTRYNTSVQIQVRRPTAGAKKFNAGLIILSKDT